MGTAVLTMATDCQPLVGTHIMLLWFAVLGMTAAATPLPNPCLPSSVGVSSFHVTNMGTGPHDANAIFPYKGTWHIMHQANWTDWAHLVSTDMVRWTRIPSALAPNGDWDGSLTILNTASGPIPVIMFDCYNVQDCNGSVVTRASKTDRLSQQQQTQGPSMSPRTGVRGSFHPLDPPLIGVAHPADLNDPNLTEWTKDPRNPISLRAADGTPVRSGFAGPSNLFQSPNSTELSFVVQLGTTIARIEGAGNDDLHNWTVADNDFFNGGGHGGRGASGLAFFPLPTQDQQADLGGFDSFLANLWVDGAAAGTQYVEIGSYQNGTFTNTLAQPIEYSQVVVFGTMQCTDGRCIHLGWFNVGAGSLTVPRELTYVYSNITGPRMLAYPVKELVGLRDQVLGVSPKGAVAAPGAPLSAFGNNLSNTFDLEATVSVPQTGTQFEVAVLAAGTNSSAKVLLMIDVSPYRDGYATITVNATVPRWVSTKAAAFNTSVTFNSSLSAGLSGASELLLPLRILADRTIVELFVDGGRVAITTPVVYPTAATTNGGVYFSTADAALPIKSSAWSMSCGWAAYP